jgi:Tol biopolymer transport system component
MGPDGSGRQAITNNLANDNSPAYSPDSRYVAYLAMTVPGFEADRQQVMLYERATGRRRSLTADWMSSVDAISWAPDSRALIAEVPERGGVSLYRIEVTNGRRRARGRSNRGAAGATTWCSSGARRRLRGPADDWRRAARHLK